MASGKITISSIKALSPGDVIWDREIKGFGCRCQQESRVFVVKYRYGKGRTARQYLYTIGKLGSPWTPDSARDEAKKILGRIANGENPAAERKAEKVASNINEAFEQFLQDSKGRRSERTQKEYRRMYGTMAKASIGTIRVQDVVRGDITKLRDMHAPTPTVSNRLLQALSAFFNWCELQGYRPDGSNPCKNINRYKEKSRERFLSEKELFALSQALNQYAENYKFVREMRHKKIKTGDKEENPVTPCVVAVIRFLIFTGARSGEALTLKWDCVDLENKLIRLQESKTGQKTIYLSAPALQLLTELPRLGDNPYVFWGREKDSHLINIKDPWRRLCQMATINLWREDSRVNQLIQQETMKLPQDCRVQELFSAIKAAAKREKINLPVGFMDVRIHDLRHNFASTAVTSGHHLKIIGSLLGHAKTATTERYAHLANDPLQTANEAIGKKIMSAMTGGEKANVVKIRKL